VSLRSRARSWLSAVLSENRIARDMEREWRFHLEARVDALVADGLSRPDAERRARMEFGDPLRLREASRDARGARLADEIRSDVGMRCARCVARPAFLSW
jgi:hypothetical protein